MPNVIRVAHFLHRIPPEYSGAALQALQLIPYIEEGGRIRNCVLAYTERPGRSQLEGGPPCTAVRIRRGVFGKLTQYLQLLLALWRTGAQVLHVHGYHRPIVLFGWVMRKRLVLKTTLFGVDDIASIRAKTPLDRYLVRKVARVISLTKRLSEVNRRWAPDIYIPNGVDTMRFAPDRDPVAARLAVGLPPECAVFLYSGGDYSRKGFQELPGLWGRIRAQLSRFSPHLVVVGHFHVPDSLPWLQERLNGKDVTMVGRLVTDVPLWLAASDIFMCLSSEEGLPNSVLEAVCMNRFVLARRIPDTYNDILSGSNSVLVDEIDDRALQCLGEHLAANRHRRIDNQGIRERLDIRRIAGQYGTLYRTLVA